MTITKRRVTSGSQVNISFQAHNHQISPNQLNLLGHDLIPDSKNRQDTNIPGRSTRSPACTKRQASRHLEFRPFHLRVCIMELHPLLVDLVRPVVLPCWLDTPPVAITSSKGTLPSFTKNSISRTVLCMELVAIIYIKL